VEDLEEAAGEGRDFLKLITEVSHDDIDDEDKYDDGDIVVWLEEMGYQWNGQSWVAVNVTD
jgi:hypothetical protein